MTITERVAAGAAFLDEHDPDWWKPDVENAIRLDVLELADPDSCVLGQRCPFTLRLNSGWPSGYSANAAALAGVTAGDIDALWEWSAPLGFTCREYDEYPRLTAEWHHIITARRSSVPATTEG